MDAQDEVMEAKRKRLKRNFDDVEVQDSSVRKPPPVPPAAPPDEETASASKATLKLRYWPPGVRTEVIHVSDAVSNGDGPATPTALGRPPSSKKKATPRTKMS